MAQERFNLPEVSSQVPIVTQHPVAQSDQRHHNKNIFFGLGIIEIIMGSLSIILAVATIIILPEEAHKDNSLFDFSGFTYISQGIWCGIFITICGILGVIVKRMPTRAMYTANMTLTIITTVITGLGAIFSGFAVAGTAYSSALVGLHATITALIVTAFATAIAHSVICCSGACCIDESAASQRYVVSS